MSYAVKEMFFTLQGEGVNAGRAAVFCRFTGCNLWTGREQDGERGPGGCSRWCDTEFVGIDGLGGARFESAAALAEAVASFWPGSETTPSRRFVVCTGGEPALQLDDAAVEALHARGFEVAIETNGTRPLPTGLDWICVSPKANSETIVRSGHELKLVFPQSEIDPTQLESWDFQHFVLQPMDSANQPRATELAVRFCMEHPRWRLSLQTHKMLGIR
jgi:7-carboxy-7-deazaguanine synthase